LALSSWLEVLADSQPPSWVVRPGHLSPSKPAVNRWLLSARIGLYHLRIDTIALPFTFYFFH
jgi:hypothetical protein